MKNECPSCGWELGILLSHGRLPEGGSHYSSRASVPACPGCGVLLAPNPHPGEMRFVYAVVCLGLAALGSFPIFKTLWGVVVAGVLLLPVFLGWGWFKVVKLRDWNQWKLFEPSSSPVGPRQAQ